MNLRIPGIAAVRSYFSFPGKRLCKPEFIVMGLVVALSLYWVFETIREIRALHAPLENMSLSALGVGIQSLNTKPQAQEFAQIAGYGIWDLQPPERKSGAERGLDKAAAPASFEQKEFGKVPAVYSVGDEKYRWEFYGVVGNGRKRAVFFNPSGKGGENSGWRQFVSGEPLDSDLVLKEIGKDRIIIFFSREQKDFVLEIFRVNQP